MTSRSDAGLRGILHRSMPEAQWTAVETGMTAGGVPDSEYCFPGGIQGWVESKRIYGRRVIMRATQVGWLMRRRRLGGRCFIAAYKKSPQPAVLMLWDGADAAALVNRRVDEVPAMGCWEGRSPADWPWDEIRSILQGSGA